MAPRVAHAAADATRRAFARPRLVVSRCLGFEACRHDGAVIREPFVEALTPWVDWIPVCPEVAIGLGTPRAPVRVVRRNGGDTLVQPSTGRDLGGDMRGFAASFLSGLEAPDGFLLKNRSPSCAIADSKVYASAEQQGHVTRGAGLFGGAVLAAFPDCAVADEGRLQSFTLREHFLTRIFASAELRQVAASGSMRRLVELHASHKLLLLAHSETSMRQLGRIVANSDRQPFAAVVAAYRRELALVLARPARFTAGINALQHALGFVSDGLTAEERAHFLELLDEFRRGKLPMSAPLSLLRSWVVRFGERYLAQQSLFEPFPRQLVAITDSGKGRG
jgi:uncharacterized protein YbgA (DUF1722 family)/uncharacterized protein YbbK (DUF523 family)